MSGTLHISQGLEVAALSVSPGREGADRLGVELRDLGRSAEGEPWFAWPDGRLRVVQVSARGAAVIEAEL